MHGAVARAVPEGRAAQATAAHPDNKGARPESAGARDPRRRMVGGRLVLAAAVMVAAYVKGRLDAAVEDTLKSFPPAPASPVATAHAQMAAAAAETAAARTGWVEVAPATGSSNPFEEIAPGWRRDVIPSVSRTPQGDPASAEAPAPTAAPVQAAVLNEYAGPIGAPAASRVVAETVVSEYVGHVSVPAAAHAMPPVVAEPVLSEYAGHVSVAPPASVTAVAAEATIGEYSTHVSAPVPPRAVVDAAPVLNEYTSPLGGYAAAPHAPVAYPVSEQVAEAPESVAPVAEVTAEAPAPLAEGDFFVSGLAMNPGDLAFGRVMFDQRLGHAPTVGQVTLHVEAAENLPAGGIAVMADGGFAPCQEGMTLVAAAEAQGRFVARGRYSVAHPSTQ